MYLHLVYSPKSFAVASGREWTPKPFRQASEVMAVIDNQFVWNSTSSSFAFLSCPFHLGILRPLGQQLTGVFWDIHWCEKHKSKSCANANFVSL